MKGNDESGLRPEKLKPYQKDLGMLSQMLHMYD